MRAFGGEHGAVGERVGSGEHRHANERRQPRMAVPFVPPHRRSDSRGASSSPTSNAGDAVDKVSSSRGSDNFAPQGGGSIFGLASASVPGAPRQNETYRQTSAPHAAARPQRVRADPGCILAVTGFPQDLASFQLDELLEPMTRAGADVHWQIPGQEALVVFRTRAQAAAALEMHAQDHVLRVRPAGAARTDHLDLSAPARKGSAKVAHRLITRSLGVRASQLPRTARAPAESKVVAPPAVQDAWSDDESADANAGSEGQGSGAWSSCGLGGTAVGELDMGWAGEDGSTLAADDSDW